MEASIFSSILYFISCTVLFGGCFLYKKKEETLAGVKWLGICIVAIMCFQTLVAGIIWLLHIPVNIISIGIGNLVAGALLLLKVRKDKKWQKYRWDRLDFLFLVLLIVSIAAFALMRYGSSLTISYLSVDASIHYKNAMGVVTNQGVFGMFFAPLNNALLIELLAPAFSVSEYYHIYVLADVLALGVSGLMFYGLIRDLSKDKLVRLVAVVLPFLFLLGYQLNSTLFGFMYLGMGVTVVAYIITVTDLFLREEIVSWFSIILIALGCYGIFECYVLFMPVVFFAILLSILVKQMGKKKLFSLETVVWGLAIFLVPCILGLYYIFSGIFHGGATVGSAINIEGGVYKELYVNFLPYIPFAVFGLYRGIREKDRRLNTYLFPMWGVFMLVLFLLGMNGRVSSYYYYKTYYVMWLLVIWMCYYGITYLSKKEMSLAVIWGVMQLALIGNNLMGVERSITAKNEMFNPTPRDGAVTSVLDFNRQIAGFPRYSVEKIELYRYVYDVLIEEKKETNIMCVSEIEDYLWYHAIINQEYTGNNYDIIGTEEFFSNSTISNYICVLYDSQSYIAEQEYYDALEPVFATEAGFVAEVTR